MTLETAWQVLGLVPDADVGEIRRAYARLLKLTSPEEDEAGFRRLRASYEQLMAVSRARDGRRELINPSEPQSPAPIVARAQPQTPPLTDIGRITPQEIQALNPIQASEISPERVAENPRLKVHFALRQELIHLFAQTDGFNEETLKTTITELLRTADKLPLRHVIEFEDWLAGLLLVNKDRANVVIGFVIRHFKWDEVHGTVGRRHHSAVGPLVSRESENEFLASIQVPSNAHHDAFRKLTSPPNFFEKGLDPLDRALVTKVTAFLSVVQGVQPGILAKLNPEALAFWRAVLKRKAFQKPKKNATLVQRLKMTFFLVLIVSSIGILQTAPHNFTVMNTPSLTQVNQSVPDANRRLLLYYLNRLGLAEFCQATGHTDGHEIPALRQRVSAMQFLVESEQNEAEAEVEGKKGNILAYSQIPLIIDLKIQYVYNPDPEYSSIEAKALSDKTSVQALCHQLALEAAGPN